MPVKQTRVHPIRIRLSSTAPRPAQGPQGGFLQSCLSLPSLLQEHAQHPLGSYLAASEESFNGHNNDFWVEEYFEGKRTHLHKVFQPGIAFAEESELEGHLEDTWSIFTASLGPFRSTLLGKQPAPSRSCPWTGSSAQFIQAAHCMNQREWKSSSTSPSVNPICFLYISNVGPSLRGNCKPNSGPEQAVPSTNMSDSTVFPRK